MIRWYTTEAVGQTIELGVPVEVYEDMVVLKGLVSDYGTGVQTLTLEQRNADGDYVMNGNMVLPNVTDNFSVRVNLIEGMNEITLTAIDGAGNRMALVTELTYVDPRSSDKICEEGGTFTSADGSKVVIPADCAE